MDTFNPDHPIVLGLAGGYATGKTVTANGLAPTARMTSVRSEESEAGPDVFWDHLYFALPLYRMATARQNIEGEFAYDRMCYEIHETLLDVFGRNPLYGAPSYDKLIEMVELIVAEPCPKDSKPRTFLQRVGTDICRAYDPECWVKWMGRTVQQEYRKFLSENRNEDGEVNTQYGIVISDCRFPNEAKFVADQPNGILIKLTADQKTIEERQFARDGVRMNTSQKKHSSETSLDSIPSEWFHEVIDTSGMTIAEQIAYVRQIVTTLTGVASYA